MKNEKQHMLEQQLKEIEEKFEAFKKNPVYPNHEYYPLMKKRTVLQRELSLEKGQETAIFIDNPYQWCSGAPLPYVVSGMGNVFLLYVISDHVMFDADNPKITVIDQNADYFTALVDLPSCYCYKFGGMNDEVISGHPLYKCGLEGYRAHYIVNSSWLKSEASINSVHYHYRQSTWDKRKHYIFTFHDETFEFIADECIADGFSVEIFKGDIKSVYDIASKRLFAK